MGLIKYGGVTIKSKTETIWNRLNIWGGGERRVKRIDMKSVNSLVKIAEREQYGNWDFFQKPDFRRLQTCKSIPEVWRNSIKFIRGTQNKAMSCLCLMVALFIDYNRIVRSVQRGQWPRKYCLIHNLVK